MGTWSSFKNPQAEGTVLREYEAVLAKWPLPLERLRVPTKAGETSILAFGPARGGTGTAVGPGAGPAARVAAKEPLVLLHGTGSNSSMWVGEAAILGRDRRVFALDIPGEPGMSAPAKMDWNGFDLADWLGEVLAALGMGGGREHSLLGISLGGWVSLSYAARRPAGLKAIALLCPAGIGRSRTSFMWKAVLAGILHGPRAPEMIMRSLYGNEEPHPEAIRVGALIAASTNARMEKPRILSDEELGNVTARVFLAAGEMDALLRSRESVERLRRALPGAEVLLLPGRGHALIGLGPEIVAFLDRVT